MEMFDDSDSTPPISHKHSSSMPPVINKISTVPRKITRQQYPCIEYEMHKLESIFNISPRSYSKRRKIHEGFFKKSDKAKKVMKYTFRTSLTQANEDNLKLLFKLYRKNYKA